MIKNPIVLLPVEEIGSLVSLIEKELPGYWYSISQNKNGLTVSVGASLYCVLDTDRAWSLTTQGDKGLVCGISYDSMKTSGVSPKDFFNDQILKTIVESRTKMTETLTEFPPYKTGRRIHDRDDRQKLRKKYSKLLRDLPSLIEHGVDIEEVYIGSCHTSADCSLRGVYGNRPFDISLDLCEDTGKMDRALEGALEDLKESLLSEKV